jgi:hypothetical protein
MLGCQQWRHAGRSSYLCNTNEFRLEKSEKLQIEEQLKGYLNIFNNHDAVQFQISFV